MFMPITSKISSMMTPMIAIAKLDSIKTSPPSLVKISPEQSVLRLAHCSAIPFTFYKNLSALSSTRKVMIFITKK